MSLGDYVRYLRALKGGPTPWQIETATGIPAGIYRQIEQRYRPVGDVHVLEELATYYGVSVEELDWRQRWSRKALNVVLTNRKETGDPLTLHLRTGDTLTGQIVWWDLGAIELTQSDDVSVVVQRHIIDRWD